MELNKKDVEQVARLARLALTEQEKEHLIQQLGQILSYVEKLKELETSGIFPTAHPFFTHSVWRADKAVGWDEIEPILENAPELEESFFKVKKIIE